MDVPGRFTLPEAGLRLMRASSVPDALEHLAVNGQFALLRIVSCQGAAGNQ